ncbi:MAG: zinc ribbon domain-containing protein [Rhodobacteraceae bacterium]|nr:zinc ribbon domain-containing protein [Paracoccaceae bacterium]
MPIYEYDCTTCGRFATIRAMSYAADPCECVMCGALSDRALAVPQLAGMDADRRNAFQTNERSAHEPRHSTKAERNDKAKHAPGCSCCSSKSKKSSAVYLPDGSKTFPSRRGWMISH